MRRISALLLLSGALASVAEAATHGPVARVLPAREGQPSSVKIYGDGDGPVKLRFTIESVDGARTELQAVEATLPVPGSTIEGPQVPPGSLGGTLIVEIVDVESGSVLSKGAAPIGA